MDWASLFKYHILERGYDYYVEDRIEIVSADENEVNARVDGSEIYDVVIKVENGNVTQMECNCPYSAKGNNCKHMAAVLYEYFGDEVAPGGAEQNENYLTHLRRESEKIKDDVERLLTIIPEEEKQQLLTKLLLNDAELRNSFKLKYDYNLDSKQQLALVQEIDAIVEENTYRGYVDWNHAYDFCWSLKQFLEERVDFIIDKGALEPAFDLTNKIFMLIGSIEMDDSDGGSSMVTEKCYAIWRKIYRNADEKFKGKIRNWFWSYKEGRLVDWIEEYLLEFRTSELATKDEILAIMKELDTEIEAHSNTNDCGYMYSVAEGRVSLIDKRIDCMRRLGLSQKEIDNYCDNHMQFYVVRIRRIEAYIEEQNYEEAIALLILSKQLDASDKSLVRSHSNKLIELFQLIGQTEYYAEELKYNLLSCSQSDVGNFKKLKSLYFENGSEGWSELVELIIEKNSESHVIYDILIEEHRFNQLMDVLDEYNNVYILEKYFKILSREVPERVIRLYANYIEESIHRACDRKAYRSIVRYLRTMSFSDIGRARAIEIANKLKAEYRRRPALIDELNKLGY
ncbi:SWIM zinc finger family protein [Pseudobutyrivibrio sp.]|uniref:SWIM zinc finger family protein n=1 Tax=Pseudobutyrivibrio sp. TaxID=2014367 RepID=UPI001DD33CE0|nr:SWIM zinc finger family protein [Pseudobutyrivibrio sp.]MBE5909831.1 hypothetical protein [Pseudobutyrivibrio sp.]